MNAHVGAGARPRLSTVLQRLRPAHSLVEMLVVLIIVGAMMALIVPAVQRSRESARQSQCINHQGQLAKAVHMYSINNSNGYFPGYRFQEPGDASAPVIGWAAQVLSYMGRNDLDPAQASYVETLVCPSDQGPTDQPRLNYVVNGGQAGVDSRADGIFYDHAKPIAERLYISKDDFYDGLGNTILLAENRDATNWNVTDEENQCILWPLIAGNEVNNGTGARPSSHHPGGFVVAFADNSVKFMAETEINSDSAIGTANSVYVAMMTPGGFDAGSGDWAGYDGDDEYSDIPPEANACVSNPSGWTSGLRGEYRLGVEQFTGTPDDCRRDDDLYYPYGTGNACEAGDKGGTGQYWFPNDTNFKSVVWTGQIRAEYTEDYQFYLSYDDGTSLIIDGATVFSHTGHVWSNCMIAVGSPVAMTAGQWVDFELSNSNHSGPGQVRLQWESASVPREDIPSSAFRTPAP
ncbi:MAG: DUF1559 domain-containing protein [Pirellulales bacterium]|nr:DUF1559 domain-containing protein [Pirellulales bacterium]